MKSLHEYMLLHMPETNYIVEGINIDVERKTVSLTDAHSKGVDMDIETNPVYWKSNGYNVISIFKRTAHSVAQFSNIDGNPFIYALKGIKGWRFNISDCEIIKYLKRFIEISSKIKPKYDTILTVPSSVPLNEKFMKHLSRLIKSENNISGLYVKETITDTFLSIDWDELNKYGEKKYGRKWSKVSPDVNARIMAAFEDMKKEGIYFKAKYFPKEYLRFVTRIIGVNPNKIEEFYDAIHEKDILILDDTISSGASVSTAAKETIKSFGPKSVTIVTLLSKTM